MGDGAQCFMNELKKELGHHPNKTDILAEYQLHIYEMTQETKPNESGLYNLLVQRLGEPREIAKLWQQEHNTTPKKAQWLFVLCNVFIFVGGALLTVLYNVFKWHWLEMMWLTLTEASFIMMLIYALFWGLIGYEIGRAFGHRGHRLLKKTFIIAIIPNLLLMYLVVFKILPYTWFPPLLNMPFIVICIIFTGCLYPISLLGYRWGRKVSI